MGILVCSLSVFSPWAFLKSSFLHSSTYVQCCVLFLKKKKHFSNNKIIIKNIFCYFLNKQMWSGHHVARERGVTVKKPGAPSASWPVSRGHDDTGDDTRDDVSNTGHLGAPAPCRRRPKASAGIDRVRLPAAPRARFCSHHHVGGTHGGRTWPALPEPAAQLRALRPPAHQLPGPSRDSLYSEPPILLSTSRSPSLRVS